MRLECQADRVLCHRNELFVFGQASRVFHQIAGLFLIPENPALTEVSSSNFSSKPFVSVLCMWPPCCTSSSTDSRDGNNAATPRLTGPNNITMTLRIERSVRQGFTVFTLSGRMEAEQLAELKELFDTDYRSIILDLQEIRLADRDAVKFLRDCEADGMKLEYCPAYVREWMDREKD